jgi:hypothetical protein
MVERNRFLVQGIAGHAIRRDHPFESCLLPSKNHKSKIFLANTKSVNIKNNPLSVAD